MPTSPLKVRRNFRSQESPELLDTFLDRITDRVNHVLEVVDNNGSGSGGNGGNGNNGTPGTPGSPGSPGTPTTPTTPPTTPSQSALLLTNGNTFIRKGTILGFLSGSTALIPALASNAALTRGLIIAVKDYNPSELFEPIVSGVHQAIVDIANLTTPISPGDPCYLSWVIPGTTINRLAPNPNKRLVLGFYLSPMDTSTPTPIAWIGFTPNLQAMTGV